MYVCVETVGVSFLNVHGLCLKLQSCSLKVSGFWLKMKDVCLKVYGFRVVPKSLRFLTGYAVFCVSEGVWFSVENGGSSLKSGKGRLFFKM